MNECLKMTMGSAQKDHELQVGKDLRDPVEFEYVQIHPGNQ